MSPAWFDPVQATLPLALRWLWLSALVFIVLWLMTAAGAWRGQRGRAFPWWLPLELGALLAAGAWVAWRCG